jgi:thiosulfate/3-mercaptopyruvate sulfurtransferase
VDANAGRLFWMLEYLGHKDVRVLDGGIEKYRSEGYGGIVSEKSAKEPTTFVASVNLTKLATKAYVSANHDGAGFSVVDARNSSTLQRSGFPVPSIS